MLRVEGNNITLKGIARTRIFMKEKAPVEFDPGPSLDFLLK